MQHLVELTIADASATFDAPRVSRASLSHIDPMRAYHDLGGTPAGPIDRNEHELQLWEKRIEALLVLLTRKKILRIDENRRGLESLGNETYFGVSYAERRMLSMSNNLILKGVITVEELAAKIAQIESRVDPLP
ncbi:MAG: putative nitrile hydratase, beta subunit [Betaproteobacteria bacterium]|nr:putative nitrile hydratase, beta subunit [Betaproteobacteria bacterium]